MTENQIPQNPAAELLALVRSWIPVARGHSPLSTRGGNHDWWEPHVRAVNLLEQVTAHVRETGVVSADGMISRLRVLIFMPNALMSGAVSQDTMLGVTDSDFGLLSSLAVSWGSTINIDAVRDLYEGVQQARALIIDAAELGDDLRDYLLKLMGSAQDALEEFQVHGAADLRRLINELVGGLVLIYPDIDEQKRGDLMRVLGRLAKGAKDLFFRDVVPALVKAAAKPEITSHIDHLGH